LLRVAMRDIEPAIRELDHALLSRQVPTSTAMARLKLSSSKSQ
jgi:hypothetical protein